MAILQHVSSLHRTFPLVPGFAKTPDAARAEMTSPRKEPRTAFIVAWVLCLIFYALQYALRSAPGVMIPELTATFGLTTLGVSSLLGVYYYTYAGFALVAGASLDRYGARWPIFVGVMTSAVGSGLFGFSAITAVESGRLLQGAGSAFAFTGAVYLAVHGFSAKWLATAIGVTQLRRHARRVRGNSRSAPWCMA